VRCTYSECCLIYEHDQFQVLTHIFAFLKLDDRKNVRLVCSSWYSCAISMSITKNEKFVFRTRFGIQDIAKFLLKPDLLVINLEFQGLPLSSLPADTWKWCGHRVQSLEFYDCRGNDETMKNIILHCVNMTSFKIDTTFCAAKFGNDKCFDAPRLMDELIRQGVKRTNLHTFEMFIDEDTYLPESALVLSKIFFIYPCIKHFSTRDFYFQYVFPDGPFYLFIEKLQVFSGLDKCLNSSTQLDSLTVNLPTYGHWMKTCISKREQGLRFVRYFPV